MTFHITDIPSDDSTDHWKCPCMIAHHNFDSDSFEDDTSDSGSSGNASSDSDDYEDTFMSPNFESSEGGAGSDDGGDEEERWVYIDDSVLMQPL